MRILRHVISARDSNSVTYIHELSGWPDFRWDDSALTEKLATVCYKQGQLLGRMDGIGFDLGNEAELLTLTMDVVKTSEIEGAILDGDQVRSSIARRLGLDTGALVESDREVDGVVAMALDATRSYDRPLTATRLFGWHAALFPSGHSDLRRIVVGAWRDERSGPMQVVSGAVGRERVHFQAPTSDRIESEMDTFLDWFERRGGSHPLIFAAIAHLWFVTIHPFEDGNGRIARAIADMALARSEGSARRFYSMSAQIRRERKAYYGILERTQKGDLDVTLWLYWFLDCLGRALDGADHAVGGVLQKARFWRDCAQVPFNPRQVKMLNRLLDGFEGKMTSSKWARIAKCSPDTALRDINGLITKGVLEKAPGGGRSTGYVLVQPTGSGRV